MTSVCVSGAGGKLAGPIIDAIEAEDDLDLVSLYNPHRAGQSIAGLVVTGEGGDVRANVVIETANPDVVFDNLEIWRDSGAAAVVGTSGFTPYRLELLQSMWGDDSPCLVDQRIAGHDHAGRVNAPLPDLPLEAKGRLVDLPYVGVALVQTAEV
jgi:dihydrodipicolinate reductase